MHPVWLNSTIIWQYLRDPFNDLEPVDSSGAAIAAQGLIRLGNYLRKHGESEAGDSYYQAGLTVAQDAFRRTVSLEIRYASRVAVAFGVSPSEWLGLCARGQEDSVR